MKMEMNPKRQARNFQKAVRIEIWLHKFKFQST